MGPAVYLEKDSALKAMESLSEEFEIFVPKPRTEDSIKARTDQYNKEKATKPIKMMSLRPHLTHLHLTFNTLTIHIGHRNVVGNVSVKSIQVTCFNEILSTLFTLMWIVFSVRFQGYE